MRLFNWFKGFIAGLIPGYCFRGTRMQARAAMEPIYVPRLLPPCGYLSLQHDTQSDG